MSTTYFIMQAFLVWLQKYVLLKVHMIIVEGVRV